MRDIGGEAKGEELMGKAGDWSGGQSYRRAGDGRNVGGGGEDTDSGGGWRRENGRTGDGKEGRGKQR